MGNPFKGPTGKKYSTYESYNGVDCYGGTNDNKQTNKKGGEDNSCAVDKYGPKKKVPGLS